MGLPAKLKKFMVFGNGNQYQGEIAEITVPKIALQTVEYQGNGMLGPIKIDLGIQALECEITVGGVVVAFIRQLGATAIDAQQLRLVGAFQADDTGDDRTVEISMRGRIEEIDMGNWKGAEDTNHKFKFALTYYKLTVNGFIELEIDMMGTIFNVGGIDRYKDIRQALGIGGGPSFSIGVSI